MATGLTGVLSPREQKRHAAAEADKAMANALTTVRDFDGQALPPNMRPTQAVTIADGKERVRRRAEAKSIAQRQAVRTGTYACSMQALV